MDKYTYKRSKTHTRTQGRRGTLRRWIIVSAVVTFSLTALNAVLLFSSNFPGQTLVSATGRSVDFTDFLIVTAAPLFLWLFGFNTWSVWSINRNSARIVSMLSQETAKPNDRAGHFEDPDSGLSGFPGRSRPRSRRHAA